MCDADKEIDHCFAVTNITPICDTLKTGQQITYEFTFKKTYRRNYYGLRR